MRMQRTRGHSFTLTYLGRGNVLRNGDSGSIKGRAMPTEHRGQAGQQFRTILRWSPFASGAFGNACMMTPPDTCVEVSAVHTCEQAVKMEFWEGFQVSDLGIPILSSCRNRNYPDPVLAPIYQDCVMDTSGANLILTYHIGSVDMECGGELREDKWVLQPATWYALVFENLAKKDQTIRTVLDWQRHQH